MEIKEIEIIHNFLIEELGFESLQLLKKQFNSNSDYFDFLDDLLRCFIYFESKENKLVISSQNILSKIKYNGDLFTNKDKINSVIEDFADLAFEGHTSSNIIYLKEKNPIFKNHLHFLDKLNKAIAIIEFNNPKKKVDISDELDFNLVIDENNWSEPEFQWLKSSIKKWDKNALVIKLNFKQALKYAAILILVIGPALFIINKINKQSATTNDLATNESKKQPESLKIEKEPYNFQLPNADSYAMEKELLREQKFGFSSSSTAKNINIKINNLSGQLTALENEIEKYKDDLSIKSYLIHKIDSINAIKETYIFNNKNGLVIYSVKLSTTKSSIQQLKLIILEKDKLYLKQNSSYYLIKKDGLSHKLIKETSEDVIDQLELIENQNE
jgi:hypothetical protein